MRTLTVIINDFKSGRRANIVLTAQDFAVIDQQWEESDRLLADLQSLSSFAGRTRWCDLSPTHYRVLLVRNLHRIAALSDTEKEDENNPTVASLTFLLVAIAKCLEERSESTVEVLRINRIDEHEVSFEFSASMALGFGLPAGPAEEQPGIRIVVDNT